MDTNNQNLKSAIEMYNGKYQCHMAASCTYHLPSPRCSTRAIQKTHTTPLTKYLLSKYSGEFSGKSQENQPLVEKWSDRRRNRTRWRRSHGTGKENPVIALREGWHQTSLASLWGVNDVAVKHVIWVHVNNLQLNQTLKNKHKMLQYVCLWCKEREGLSHLNIFPHQWQKPTGS